MIRASCAALVLMPAAVMTIAPQSGPSIGDRIVRLTRSSVWTLERSIPLAFAAHHPQGLVKIGDRLFISSVEIKTPTKRLAAVAPGAQAGGAGAGGFDRDTGDGVGHVFEATLDGRLVADQIVGDGTMYHPGGIDFDGTHIWVSVAEYRPNSRSIVYRIDPATRRATEVFRFADHLGGIIRNPDDNTLHAVSWGSRWFYRFVLDENGRVTNADAAPASIRTANRSHYVDYQDCKYAGARRMVCTGIADVPREGGQKSFTLGGIDLVDFASGAAVHQVPIGLTTPGGASLTRNPSFFEATASGLRAYFVPDDDKATLYVYAIDLPR